VIGNMAGVDTIARGEPPENPTRILQASLLSEHKAPPVPAPAAPAPAAAPSVADLNHSKSN